MNWFTAIRPLARLTRELRLIRLALTRLADAAERTYPAPHPVDEAPEPPLELANSPTDFGRLFEVEQGLRRTLGRDPDPDELLRAFDGDAEVVLKSRSRV